MAPAEELLVEALPLQGFPKAAHLRLSGSAGPHAVRRLQAAIQPLLAEGKKDFLLDCAHVEAFNSTALGYFINLAGTLKAAGGAIAFCRITPGVDASFNLLGLRELFATFADENEWATQALEHTPSPPLDEAETLGAAETFDLPAVLPAWLDEAGPPLAPPLDHLRWSALLQKAARELKVDPLGQLAGRLAIPKVGPMLEVMRQVLRKCQTPQELLGLLEEEVLGEMCRLYGLPVESGKAAHIETLMSFVQRTTLESLAGLASEPPKAAAAEAATEHLRANRPGLTPDRVLRVLETCAVPRRLRGDRAAAKLVWEHVRGALGKEGVTRDRKVGKSLKTKVDLDLSDRFGILVRAAGTLLGKATGDAGASLKLLGQLVLLGGVYGRGNLAVILVGALKKDQSRALGELKGSIENAGGRLIHLR